jgi:CRP/FNR family cyclic AMP-dependent transcriptional regulator
MTLEIADGLGFLGAALMLFTFCQRIMLRMRISALAANVCFIAYGALAHVYPVLLLHALLMPVNLKGLFEQFRAKQLPFDE